MQELALEDARGVITPRGDEPRRKEGDNEEELSAEEATRYKWGIAARVYYLAAGRPDIMYAVKELCHGMARPTRAYRHKLNS